MEVMIGGVNVPVTITRKSMRNITLRVGRNGELRVSCPKYTSEKEIRFMIYRNEAWILQQQLRRRKEEEVNREGINGDSLFWLGERKTVRRETARRDSILVDGDEIIFYLKEENDERIQKTFRNAASKQLLAMSEEAREPWDRMICDANGIARPQIKTRYMTSRWGVCYPEKHTITLSTRLIHYPQCCFEYVLLHEYAHFLVRNHSAAFYQVVSRYMPDYKERRKLLK